MAKKGKKKGLASSSKGGSSENLDGHGALSKLSETDKEWYTIQIRSYDEKLKRRNAQISELESSNLEYKERYEQMREDKLDIVCYLKRLLLQRTNLIMELQTRLKEVQTELDNEVKESRAQIEKMKTDFGKTTKQMESDNMVLMKKLDALDEFRVQRQVLLQKFNDQTQEMEDMKKEHEDKMKLCNKKHLQERDSLKKEMMEKLEEVAADFRHVSHARMAASTRRTLRENCSLFAQVSQLSTQVSQVSVENDVYHDQIEELKQKIRMLECEQDAIVKKSSYRMKVIEELSKKCKEQKDEIGDAGTYKTERRNLENKIKRLENEVKRGREHAKQSENDTNVERVQLQCVETELGKVMKSKFTVDECLQQASHSIQNALTMNSVNSDDDKADVQSKRDDVLNQLLALLNKACNDNNEASVESDYLHGVLGLVQTSK